MNNEKSPMKKPATQGNTSRTPLVQRVPLKGRPPTQAQRPLAQRPPAQRLDTLKNEGTTTQRLDSLRNEQYPTVKKNSDQNATILKQINKGLNKKKRISGDVIRIIVITLLSMIILTVLLIFVANFEIPELNLTYVDSNPILPPATIVDNAWREQDATIYAEDLIEHIFYWERGGTLELPVIGATGWAATSLVLRAEASTNASSRANLAPGDGFTILDGSVDGWWQVRLPRGTEGWVEIRRCFINLPDVLPSIVYNQTNARASRFTSSYVPLPDVWGERLYEAHSFNERLRRYEYHVPAMYTTAQALFRVQQMALNNGETLVIYEVFRPRSAQVRTRDSLNALVRENHFVAQAFTGGWSVGNFISQGVSNHQRGGAVDAAMGIVREQEILQTGNYSFVCNGTVRSIHGTSSMHELSPYAVLPRDRNSALGRELHEVIWNMRDYFLANGFRPLASEWWHFDHTASINTASSVGIVGDFYTSTIYSVPPVRN